MTGRRLLPKIGMRYKVLYILAFLLCANSLFLQIESPIITIGDKWYASIILLLLFLIANSTFSMSSFSWSLNKLLPSFYIIVLLSDVVLAMHGILQYTHIIPFHSYLGLSGSFDNPAGYAASLCAGFPAVFYALLFKTNKGECYSCRAMCYNSCCIVRFTSRDIKYCGNVYCLFFTENRNRFSKEIFVVTFITISGICNFAVFL